MSFEPGVFFVGVMLVWLIYALMPVEDKKKDYMSDDTEEKEEPKKKEGKKNV